MTKYAVALIAVVALVAGLGRPSVADEPKDPKDEAVRKELKALAGTWRPTSRETDGNKASEEDLKDIVATRDEQGKVSIRRGDQVVIEGTTKLDLAKKPKEIDTVITSEGENKGKNILGIYELDGDTLRLCIALPGSGGERPKEFSGKAGSGQHFVVYKREKKSADSK